MNRNRPSIPPVLPPSPKPAAFPSLFWLGLPLAALLVLFRATSLWRLAPACGFREWSGFCCPFCGGTRSLLALSFGDWQTAFGLNPLVAAFAAAVLLGAGLRAVTLLIPPLGSRAEAVCGLIRAAVRWVAEFVGCQSRSLLWLSIAAIVALNWVYLLLQGR